MSRVDSYGFSRDTVHDKMQASLLVNSNSRVLQALQIWHNRIYDIVVQSFNRFLLSETFDSRVTSALQRINDVLIINEIYGSKILWTCDLRV